MFSVRNYNSLDLGKFVFAFAVVAIHTNPLINCDNIYITTIYEVLVRFAVPFFFITAGYLLASKFVQPLYAQENILRVQKQLKKITKMYLLWTLAYAPLAAGYFISTHTPLPRAFLIYLRGFIFVGEQYNSWPLWYLLATIYALILFWLVLKLKLSFGKLICIWASITIISITFDFLTKSDIIFPHQVQFVQLIVKYTTGTGRIFQGVTYIPLGMLLYYKKPPQWMNWLLFLGMGLLLGIANSHIVLTDLLRIAGAVGLFSIISYITLKNRPFYPFLRNTSMFIYLFNPYVYMDFILYVGIRYKNLRYRQLYSNIFIVFHNS